ncbi:hypothetical protein [Virgibacillus oceani]|uniref:Uncharacterized protein n=1 Tax=Virgibacillus oceani TaxID=1479511 RepID=A0A917M5S1_9BACI|nr:hypothetical protein [Virgibacillus oceani]GGG79076.1 hypothetical protein GCM10011398_25480 [Virgibacillus oceani]
MKVTKILLPICGLLIILFGCSQGNRYNTTGNPTPEDFLENKDADIFLLDGIVFSNAQDVEWVAELEYKLGKRIGEITKQTDNASRFKDGTANKLQVGTKIYETDTPAFIAIVNDKEIPYLKMIEG